MREHLHRYEDEAVVFNPHTWQTHVLNPAATLVIDQLRARPHDLHSLHEALAQELHPQDMEALNAENLAQLLAELESLRLLLPESA